MSFSMGMSFFEIDLFLLGMWWSSIGKAKGRSGIGWAMLIGYVCGRLPAS